MYWSIDRAALAATILSIGSAAFGACPTGSNPQWMPPTDVRDQSIRTVHGVWGAPRPGQPGPHKGVDLVFSETFREDSDYAVKAVAAGTIAYAQVNEAFSGYGLVVVIDHGNNCYSFYAHLAHLAHPVAEAINPLDPYGLWKYKLGDSISAGQIIGYLRNSEWQADSTGNAGRLDATNRRQLHFSLIEAPPGRTSTVKLVGADGILPTSEHWTDPTSLLVSWGYQERWP